MTTRTLQDFGRDVEARKEAETSWHEFKTETTGDAAAFRSRYGLALQQAQAPAPAAAASAVEAQRSLSSSLGSSQASTPLARRYGLSPSGPNLAYDGVAGSKARLVEYSQTSKFVGGKTFFLNQSQWIDSAVQSAPNAKHIRVQLSSPEYFELAAQGPNVSAWLALGSSVQFLLGDTVYEIYE
jgi:hypothetical protein